MNVEVGKVGLNLDRSKIPERYAFAWFEEETKQDEPENQELFARGDYVLSAEGTFDVGVELMAAETGMSLHRAIAIASPPAERL